MPVPTVDARILLGWMDRLTAVPYLQNECCFERPLTAEEAEGLWLTHRNRVEALPARRLHPPQRFPIPTENRQLVNQFLAQFRGPEVLDVIKIDPMQLAIYQMYVVTDRADHHANETGDWAKKTLVLNRPIVQLPWRVEDGALKLSLPHAEHQIWFNPNGTYGIQQGGGFVSVAELDGRLFLKAGYHRSFAFSRAVMNEPEASDKSVLVALTKTLPSELCVGFPLQGLRTNMLGPCPPLFSDFFDCDLAMTVKLRKKKFEAHLTGRIVAVDAP